MHSDIFPSKEVLLHIGFHKTASTWFQSELFSQSEFGFCSLQARNIVHNAFCQSSPFANDSRTFVEQILAEAQDAAAAGKCFVVSHERLSGYPASGGFDSRVIADRLKYHFPNARVICLIREQRAMLLSVWRQQIVDGGGATLRRFLRPPQPYIKRVPLFDPSMYRYSHLMQHYQSIFGKERVAFIPYEEFFEKPAAIIEQIADLIDNDTLRQNSGRVAADAKRPNPSLSMTVLGLHRLLNVLFARTQLSPNCLINLGERNIRAAMRLFNATMGWALFRPVDRVLEAKAKARIADFCKSRFDEDNLLLSRLLDKRLSELGYSVSNQGSPD